MRFNNIIILIVLLVSFSFSQGKRTNKPSLTIEKVDSFENIVGWINTGDKWYSEENYIRYWNYTLNTPYGNNSFQKSNGRFSLKKLESYSVKEHPDISILLVYTNKGQYRYDEIKEDWYNWVQVSVLIFERNEIEKLFSNKLFKIEELDTIKIPVYNGNSWLDDLNERFLYGVVRNKVLKNLIKGHLNKYFSDKEKIEEKFGSLDLFYNHEYESTYDELINYSDIRDSINHFDDSFKIHYYIYEDKIQYFLETRGYIIGYNLTTYDKYEFPEKEIKKFYDRFKNEYFESNFNELNNFFKSLN